MTDVQIDGVAYPIKPLNFAALRQNGPDIRAMLEGSWPTPEALFGAMTRIVHSSLQRSAPQLTVEQVEAALDWPTAKSAVESILESSFPMAKPGESRVESPSGPSTGTAPSPN